MDPSITPFDLHRMFFGDFPPLYYAEIAVRVAVIYAYTLVLIRWIGARGVAQLSMIELLLVIALGSAVGDAIFYGDVPLVIAMWVITLVVLINKVLDKVNARSQRLEELIDGKPIALVREGVLVTKGLHARDLGVNEVKAMLRREGVANLGQVKHAYLEINGDTSVFRFDHARPGLAIVPPQDVEPPEPLGEGADVPRDLACCGNCGQLASARAVVPDSACPNCDKRHWTAPFIPPEPETLAES